MVKQPLQILHNGMSMKTMSIAKIARKRTEHLLRDMFKSKSLTGDERPINVWSMQQHFMDTYARGSSSWRNVLNRVKRECANMSGDGKILTKNNF